MVSLLTAETCAKLEPEDGEIMWQTFNTATKMGYDCFENTLHGVVLLLRSVISGVCLEG